MQNIRKSFSISDQIFFSQRLSLLLDSGISLIDSLNIIRSMDTSKSRRMVFDILIKDCEHGISLSKSIIQSKVKFDLLLITLIKNGEYSGSLISALSQISKNLEKRNELKKKIISTLIYPIFIFIATICMSLFLILYIFPKILPLLGTLDIKLPFLTIVVKTLYEYSIHYGIQFSIIIILLISLFFFLMNKYIYIKSIIDKFLLILPFLGIYLKLQILASLCSTGEMLLSSGRSLSEFHLFSSESSSNIIYKRAFKNIYLESIKGVSFSNSMKSYNNLFLQTMIDMCSIGERTGNLALMLGHCSTIFDQDIDIFFKRFSSLIEPILMIFMGLIVGSIALSIILPVYEITNHLTR